MSAKNKPQDKSLGEKGINHPADLDLTLRVDFFNPMESATRSLARLKVG
jgi:hypothetical protein